MCFLYALDLYYELCLENNENRMVSERNDPEQNRIDLGFELI